MGISCDICKYGESHDYVNGNYYCRNNNCIHRGGDFPTGEPTKIRVKFPNTDKWIEYKR